MKKLCTSLLMLLSLQVFAQSYPITNINITLPSNPDANTANWGTGSAIFSINASANTTAGRVDAGVMESKMLVTIKKSGAKICGAFTASNAPASHFSSAVKTWSGQEAYSLIGQSCVLAPGDYELCVQFFGYSLAAAKPLSEEKCKSFSIRGNSQQVYQAPHLLSPFDGNSFSEMDIKRPITFRWTPVVPAPTDRVSYKLSVWQLMEGQTGVQAMKGGTNKPIFERDTFDLVINTNPNIFNGPKTPPYTNKFIWNVQAFGKDGKPIGENNGKSENFSFNTKSLMTAGSCNINIDSARFVCSGYGPNGFPTYGFTIYLKNSATVGTTYLGHTFTTNGSGNAVAPTNNGTYFQLFNTAGSISNLNYLTSALTTIPNNTTKIITGTYSLSKWADTCFRFKIWTSTLISSGAAVTGNACESIKDTCLKVCVCKDCDNAKLNANNLSATQVSGTPSQYNLAGNFSLAGLPQNVQAIEVQVSNFDFSNKPGSCSYGIASIENSGVIMKPSTTINNQVPIFQNVLVTNNTNVSKNVKLIIGGAGLVQPTTVPFSLTIGVPAPLTGLDASCCKIDYNICFKVTVYYGISKDNCQYCDFYFCKSFSNQ